MVSALVFLDYEFLFNWHVQNIEQNRISKFRSFLFLSWNLEHHFRDRLGCAPAWEISVQPKSGKHITDTHISETDTTELENLRHNIIDVFIIET